MKIEQQEISESTEKCRGISLKHIEKEKNTQEVREAKTNLALKKVSTQGLSPEKRYTIF